MKLEPGQTFSLSRHGDLKRRGSDRIFVLPERAIRIGGSGAEILELLREPRSLDEVVGTLRARYPDDAAIEAAVISFVNEMIELGGVVHVPPDGARE